MHNGTKEPARLWLTFLILAFLAVVSQLGFTPHAMAQQHTVLSLLSQALGLVSITERSITFNIGLRSGSIFTFIGFVVLLWLSFLVVQIVRWVLYWLILGAVLLVFVDGHPTVRASSTLLLNSSSPPCWALYPIPAFLWFPQVAIILHLHQRRLSRKLAVVEVGGWESMEGARKLS